MSTLSYVIPSGSFERKEVQLGQLTRTVVITGSYEKVPKNYSVKGFLVGDEVDGKATPVGLLGFLSAIKKGLERSTDIIFFIF